MNETNDALGSLGETREEPHVTQDAPTPLPAPPAPAQPRRVSKFVWIAGCSALFLMFCAAVAVAFVLFGLPWLSRDPIVSAVPADSAMYMSFDLIKTQSQDFADIVSIAQEIADVSQSETMAESADRFMNEELGMSFTEDMLPWVGRHGALVFTDLNINDGTFEMMVILESRNQAKADEFLQKFTAALEDRQGATFEQRQENGVTFYVDPAEYDYEEDLVLARSGKLVYLSNSQSAVSDSINMNRGNSLSSRASYKNVLAALPKDRLATFYLNGERYAELMSSAMSDAYGFNNPYLQDFAATGLDGIGMSLSMQQQGLRVDMAVSYDEQTITEYQKEVLSTRHLAPTTDGLVPENTFLFIAANSPKSPNSYTQVDNPLYSSDMTEAFNLLEQETGIQVRDLVDILGGEFAVAVGPASDGLLVESGGINMGFTVLAGTSDEQRFNDWMQSTLNTLFEQDPYTEYNINDTTIGDYSLKELSIQTGGEPMPALVYGADHGFIVFGTSPSMLEAGFTNNATLADNATYRQTWQAFPRGSVPYVYLNLSEFMNFLADSADEFGSPEVRDAEQRLRKIPVVAMSMNGNSGNVQSATMIIFIDKNR